MKTEESKRTQERNKPRYTRRLHLNNTVKDLHERQYISSNHK